MSEYIRLPEEPVDPPVYEDVPGCVIIKQDDGNSLPLSGNFEPFVLTCIPTDAIIVETQSLGFVEDLDFDSELVLGFGYPDSMADTGDW